MIKKGHDVVLTRCFFLNSIRNYREVFHEIVMLLCCWGGKIDSTLKKFQLYIKNKVCNNSSGLSGCEIFFLLSEHGFYTAIILLRVYNMLLCLGA